MRRRSLRIMWNNFVIRHVTMIARGQPISNARAMAKCDATLIAIVSSCESKTQVLRRILTRAMIRLHLTQRNLVKEKLPSRPWVAQWRPFPVKREWPLAFSGDRLPEGLRAMFSQNCSGIMDGRLEL